ncbi:MAG: hypothetical protein ABIG61_05155 [Planctomycetota bacterium]
MAGFNAPIDTHTGKRGRPKGSRRIPAKGLTYATVHKTRRKGRVVKIDLQTVFGSKDKVETAIQVSAVSKTINTAFVERHNGTDRNRNARKVRKSYCFSKDWNIHNAMTYFTMFSYNFCCRCEHFVCKTGTTNGRREHRRWSQV